jgi:hypothetical protein
MKRTTTMTRARATTAACALLLVGACAGPASHGPAEPAGAPAAAPVAHDPLAGVNTVSQDRAVWQRLLADHAKIRRTVRHRQEGATGIVEARTESDDPAVAARIQEHARAMHARVQAGAPVRVWDPVFKELFARHGHVSMLVTPTPKGVRIKEWSDDPQTVALLREHAMGVSAFIREGPGAGGRATARWPAGAGLPPDEHVHGGVPGDE